jgi:hypothetical protein
MLNWADDEGYFMANPILIRGQVFPFEDDSKKIPRSLQELSSEGWIQLGVDNQGRAVGKVVNFAKHQRVDKPKPSSIKENSTFQDESKMNPRRFQDTSKEEGKGREEERNGIRVSNDTLVVTQPIGWNPTDGWSGITENDHADWKVAYPACDASRQLASMAEWLRSNPARAKKTAWRRFITAWLNREQERGGDLRHTSSSRSFSGYPSAKQTASIDQLMGGRTLSITDMSQTAKIEQPEL